MQSHYFEYLGVKLHYQLGGKETAPVMVLLHGGLGSIDDFAALLPRLQQHFRVVAWHWIPAATGAALLAKLRSLMRKRRTTFANCCGTCRFSVTACSVSAMAASPPIV